ncbi:MAG: cell division protein FtsL, partial [Salinispira sp.]
LAVMLPLLLFAHVLFTFQSYELENEIDELQELQSTMIERNKRLITGISVLRSPGRIIEKSREMGMSIPEKEQIVTVEDNF